MKKDSRTFVEILIAGLLIFSVWSFTRYYRNEQLLNLQAMFMEQKSGIEQTTLILQSAINSGRGLNVKALQQIGWTLTIPQPAEAVKK